MIQPSILALPCLEALEPRLAPAGIVAVSVKGGALTLTGTVENDNVEIYDAGGGQWGIRDGGGSGTTFSLNGEAAAAEVLVTVTRGIKVDLKEGNDILTLDGITVNGTVSLKDKAGNNEVEITGSEIHGTVKLDLGAGDDDVKMEGSTLHRQLTIKGGAGVDAIELSTGTYHGITVDLGTDNGGLILGSYSPGSSVQVEGNVSITAKAGEGDTVQITLGAEDFLISGNVKVKLGHSVNGLLMGSAVDGSRFEIAGGMSYTGGTAVDTVSLDGEIIIGGRLDLKMGKGDSNWLGETLDSLTLGSLRYTGGTGENFINLAGDSLLITGDALFKSSPAVGTDYNFDFDDEISIGRSLTVKGGHGYDTFSLLTGSLTIQRTFNVTTGNGYNVVDLSPDTASLGALTFKGGSNQNSLYTGSFGPHITDTIEILGKTKINMGKGTYNETFLTDTTFHGSVSILSATPQAAVGNYYEALALADSTFLSALSIKTTGAHGGIISLTHSTFQAAVTLNTGKGNDMVYLDSEDDFEAGTRIAKNLFEGPVKILLGAGDDLIHAGTLAGTADEGNIFNSTVSLDGGPGTDTDSTAPNRGNTYNGELTEKNFETPMP